MLTNCYMRPVGDKFWPVRTISNFSNHATLSNKVLQLLPVAANIMYYFISETSLSEKGRAAK